MGPPDDKGERVTAILQLRLGGEAPAEEVIAFAKKRIGSAAAPKKVVV